MSLMDAQAKGKTGLVKYADGIKGASRVQECFAELKGTRLQHYAVVDAADNLQLEALAGSSGVISNCRQAIQA